MKCKYKNTEVFDVVQWDYWQTPNGVKEKRRGFIDRLLTRPIGLDNNWYVETPDGKVWLTRNDYIVTDIFGTQRVYREDEFEKKFEIIQPKKNWVH